MSDLYGGLGNNMNNPNNNGMNTDEKKKMLIIAGAAIVGVIIIAMIIIAIISSINNQKNNLYIDGKATKLNTSILYVDENNVPYVCVEKIAPKLAYKFYNGEYGTGNEDKSHCYVSNDNEIALLEMDSNVVYKALTNDDTTFDTYKMSYRVKRNNDLLYISLPTMQKVFNVKYSYNADKNTLTISTLPALYQKYNASVKADNYQEMSKDFSNQKALIEDMIVVITKDRQMGVISTKDKSTIIGAKYPKLTYSEGMGEFIAEQNKKYGILVGNTQGDATVKVGFSYDSLKLIDNNIGLYLAENSKKYGVLDKNGRILINLEYDKIGLENPKLFPTDDIKNSYVLYDQAIPVKQGDKWGMFNVLGKQVLAVEKYGFGCIASTSTNQTAQNVLLIPASEGIEGIVISDKNYLNQLKHGVYDVNGVPRTSNTFDSIYKTTNAGQTEYYTLFHNTIGTVKEAISNRAASDNTGTSNPGTVQIN